VAATEAFKAELEQRLLAIGALAKTNKGLIGTPSLEGGGKKQPAKAPGKLKLPKKPKKGCACGKSTDEECDCEETASKTYFEIAKANDEEQTVTGVVLMPETVDAQGDIYSADVIKQAAYDFLASYNATTKLGRQHKDFANWTNRFALVESYLAPMEFALNTRIIKAGSWIMTVKVLDAKVWKMVKDGKITGFSIGGKARVKQLTNGAES
jgi:putative serine protease XkdF